MSRRAARPDLPRDPATVLRALRACRTAMESLCAEVKIGGPVYIAANAIMAAIDALARVLTGSGTYFHGLSSGATAGELRRAEEWDAIERGEKPWPKQ